MGYIHKLAIYVAPLLETTYLAPLYWCHDARPCCGTLLYTEGPALIHPYWRCHSDNQSTIKMQLQTTYLIFVQ